MINRQTEIDNYKMTNKPDVIKAAIDHQNIRLSDKTNVYEREIWNAAIEKAAKCNLYEWQKLEIRKLKK